MTQVGDIIVTWVILESQTKGDDPLHHNNNSSYQAIRFQILLL